MQSYRVTLACRNYDRTSAIIHGLVKAEGIDLQVFEIDSAPHMFTRMFRGEFDVSEFTLAELVYYTSIGKSSFIGIPVFPLRRFRHGFIFCNISSDIKGPESLQGKRIGFLKWVQTAAIWIRGLLVDEYDISPQNTSWYVASMHHWDDGDGDERVRPRDGSVINWLEGRGKDVDKIVEEALIDGKVDAFGTPQCPMSFIKGDKRVKRLFENYKEAEVSYYKKTRIFPIMHVLVTRKSLVEEHPDLPKKLFDLFLQSKRLGEERIRTDTRSSLIWTNQYIAEEQELFQGDPWAYGLEKNHHVISKFLSYCYEQGVSDRKMSPKELFAPSTWDLTE